MEHEENKKKGNERIYNHGKHSSNLKKINEIIKHGRKHVKGRQSSNMKKNIKPMDK